MGPMALKRCKFTRLFAEWIIWVNSQPGLMVNMSEGYVADTDAADGDYDGPHKRKGGHYKGLANDVNLFRNGVYVADGEDPAWKTIGEKWESMDGECRWGGRFGDANHISLIDQGVQ